MPVTAIVRYDLFPKYRVSKGWLQGDGSVKVNNHSYYRAESIIRVLPPEKYEDEKERLERIIEDYRENERQLRIDILAANKVNFITIK
ncbi:hypothetical protein [Salmonella phage SSBI34]|nr:hypothetical protein [Salmonella phage SSBI34]